MPTESIGTEEHQQTGDTEECGNAGPVTPKLPEVDVGCEDTL